jgi:DNA-binding response OmpR family regulator
MDRVLIVENDPHCREWMEGMLRFNSYDCVSATDEMEAMKLCRENSPDIIVADIDSAEHCIGPDYIKALKEEFPEVYILAVARNRLMVNWELEKAIDFGADEAMKIPKKTRTLVGKIHSMLH